MRYSGIGGQAVMEGVMMRNGDRYAVAVRKPDHEIEVKVSEYSAAKKTNGLRGKPLIRGIFSFIDSMVLGMGTLMYSASFFDEESENLEDLAEERKEDLAKKPGVEGYDLAEGQTRDQDEAKRQKLQQRKKREDSVLMGFTVALSIVFAIAIFFALPYFLSTLLHYADLPEELILFVEGILRLAIFVAYIALISLNSDIRRVYMYHGAEHKCINCIERGWPLSVENVRKSPKEHKRCGTSFLLVVMLVSILLFLFIRVEERWLQLLCRLLLIPVIAGISYEFLQLAGRSDNRLVNTLSKPGLWLQGLTTREPDDDMIEVGIASVEAVFDWKKWQRENGL